MRVKSKASLREQFAFSVRGEDPAQSREFSQRAQLPPAACALTVLLLVGNVPNRRSRGLRQSNGRGQEPIRLSRGTRIDSIGFMAFSSQ